LVGNSLLSKFGSEQDINKNSGNINNNFFMNTITLYTIIICLPSLNDGS
jgi:hypothetical protein